MIVDRHPETGRKISFTRENVVYYIDENGDIREVDAADMQLSYRHSFFSGKKCVIVSVTMELKQGDKSEIKAKMDDLMGRRRDKQPLEFPSCGSTFKRPEGYFAAALIEECGLKGFSIGGAQVSEKHSGFVINRGGASFEDIMALVKFANDRGIEAWGYHADSREAAIRCLKLGFTNITANDPHDLIAYLDEVGRRVGK